MQDFGPWGLYPNMNHYILYSVMLDAPLRTTEVPKLPWRILTRATRNISQTFTWYLESEQSKTECTTLNYDSSFPQDLKDITPIVHDQTETERKLCLKRWKWPGVEHWQRKASSSGKRKGCVALQCYLRWDSVCAGDKLRVAGQCSHQCLKSTADQDKLSHSNKLHIPALIWP